MRILGLWWGLRVTCDIMLDVFAHEFFSL